MTDDNRDYLQVITEAGLKSLRDDTQMDDEDRLILEVMAAAGAISE